MQRIVALIMYSTKYPFDGMPVSSGKWGYEICTSAVTNARYSEEVYYDKSIHRQNKKLPESRTTRKKVQAQYKVTTSKTVTL